MPKVIAAATRFGGSRPTQINASSFMRAAARRGTCHRSGLRADWRWEMKLLSSLE